MQVPQLSNDFKAVQWDGRYLRILDQTKLPEKVGFVVCTEYQHVIDAIKRLAVRGAPNIGVAGAFAVVLALKEKPGKASLDAACTHIAAARPTAVNLSYAVNRVRQAALAHTGKSLPNAAGMMYKAAEEEAVEIDMDEFMASEALTKHGAELWEKMGVKNFMTVCNTGRLAGPGYGTALGTILRAKCPGSFVYAMETRPLLQGLRLTAWELEIAKRSYAVVPDGAAASVMGGSGKKTDKKFGVDVVVVGADRIAANGDTANKIGTRNLAELAHLRGIPFYVVAPTSTIDFATKTGEDIHIENRTPFELTRGVSTIDGERMPQIQNPAFDVTPAKYITGFITEKGVMDKVTKRALAA